MKRQDYEAAMEIERQDGWLTAFIYLLCNDDTKGVILLLEPVAKIFNNDSGAFFGGFIESICDLNIYDDELIHKLIYCLKEVHLTNPIDIEFNKKAIIEFQEYLETEI